MQKRVELNSVEKLARSYTGLDSTAKHFTMNGQSADNLLEIEATNKLNDQIDEYTKKFEEHATNLDNYKKCMED